MFKKIGIASIIAGSTVVGSYMLYKYYDKQTFKTDDKKQILLVGYGYAGRSFYDKIDKSKYDIKVICCKPIVLQPNFLDSLETNSVSKIKYDIDNENKNFKICDDILSIKSDEKTLQTYEKVFNKVDQHKYDYLVMAIGHETNTFGIPGADSYCNFYTSYDDLEKLRHISNEKKLKIAVIGASLAGLEIAGYLSENHDIDVIEYANTILPTMKNKTQNTIYDLLSKHGINFKLKTRVLEITEKNDKKIIHVEIDGNTKNEQEYDIVIWTAGVKPNQNMTNWLNTNKVNEKLQLDGKSNIYAIGDCNNTMPKSGQNAKKQGQYLANIFNSNFDNKENYKYTSMGIVVKLPNCVYIESDYYCGFGPRIIHDIVNYFNI